MSEINFPVLIPTILFNLRSFPKTGFVFPGFFGGFLERSESLERMVGSPFYGGTGDGIAHEPEAEILIKQEGFLNGACSTFSALQRVVWRVLYKRIPPKQLLIPTHSNSFQLIP